MCMILHGAILHNDNLILFFFNFDNNIIYSW